MKKIFYLCLLILFMMPLSGCKPFFRWYYGIKAHNEDLRREVFEETKSYNQGMVQQLVRYRKEYYTTDDESEKQMILSTVNIMYADYENYDIDEELKSFLDLAKYGY